PTQVTPLSLHDALPILLQAYLHRTEQDVKDAVARGDRVRICKGAYKEPPEIAWKKMDDIRASYRRCAELLLEKGHYPAIATHDEDRKSTRLNSRSRVEL